MTRGQYLSEVKDVWISDFFLLDMLPKQELKTSLVHYILREWKITNGFIPFSSELAMSKTPAVSSSIWSQFDCISYADNHYTKDASKVCMHPIYPYGGDIT